MSIKDRLAKKTADLMVSAPETSRLENPAAKPSKPDEHLPRTGPGQMLAFRSHMLQNNAQVEALSKQVEELSGSIPARMLDPSKVLPSKWANRHESSFLSKEFIELKAEIASSGGNVQAICVRPHPTKPGWYELAFGHRRHRACLDLGLPVLALIEAIDDEQLFSVMDRENRTRADLSPFEQGTMYRRALDEGLYPSLRQLAASLTIDLGNASKAISIARLPEEVIAAFEHPTQIQFRWGQALLGAIQKDPEGVIERAKSTRFSTKKLPPLDAMARLLGVSKPANSISVVLKKEGRTVGKLVRQTSGAVALSLQSDALDEHQFAQLEKTLLKLLSE